MEPKTMQHGGQSINLEQQKNYEIHYVNQEEGGFDEEQELCFIVYRDPDMGILSLLTTLEVYFSNSGVMSHKMAWSEAHYFGPAAGWQTMDGRKPIHFTGYSEAWFAIHALTVE